MVEDQNILDIEDKREVAIPKLMLKKIKREVAQGQVVLHISDRQSDIEMALKVGNSYFRTINIDSKELSLAGIKNHKKAFTYVIADLRCVENIDKFLDDIQNFIVRPGLLILTAENICTWKNKLNIFFNLSPSNFDYPYRAMTPVFLRNKVLEKGYFIKNRFWMYGDKLLLMADIPIS